MERDSRRIDPRERSGVLRPENLARYSARWFTPDPRLDEIVQHEWSVAWDLPPGEVITQRILSAPLITLSFESGAVPAAYVVTGVHRTVWTRDIRASGIAFGIRLQPAALSLLSGLSAADVANSTLPVTRNLDANLHELMTSIGEEQGRRVLDLERLHARTNSVLLERLPRHPPADSGLLANRIVRRLMTEVPAPRLAALALDAGVSERTVQRALERTVGHGPKWIARWVRLQEVARRLAEGEPISDVAAAAGYADQAHLTGEFRASVGTTPGEYVRSLQSLASGRISGSSPS